MLTSVESNVYCDKRLGNEQFWYSPKPEDADMRVPNIVLKCVCFLCVKSNGQASIEKYKYGGTAFFVGVPSERHPITYIYLVTAKHCIQKAQQKGGLYLRLNTKDGQSRIINFERDWHYHDNEASDVAVLPWAPPPKEYDYSIIRTKMFLTSDLMKQEAVGQGDDLVITGLFTQKAGGKKNIPIVRIGSIATIPDEPFQDEFTEQDYFAYIAEIRSIGGLSGSPVFVLKKQLERDEKKTVLWEKAFLLGLVRGHWDYKGKPLDYAGDELEAVNMGMAIITPINDALEIINSEELVKDRRKLDRDYTKENAPTMDNQFQDEADYTKDDFLQDLRKVSQKKSDEERS